MPAGGPVRRCVKELVIVDSGRGVRAAGRATYIAFIGSGLVLASWAARIPQIHDGLGLSPSRRLGRAIMPRFRAGFSVTVRKGLIGVVVLLGVAISVAGSIRPLGSGRAGSGD
jgi:hypothetical protein